MICEHCGNEINYLNVDVFRYDGTDTKIKVLAQESENNAVFFEVDQNWCGCELSEEEANETISCPFCGNNPFEDNEIQVYDIVRVVKFKTEQEG